MAQYESIYTMAGQFNLKRVGLVKMEKFGIVRTRGFDVAAGGVYHHVDYPGHNFTSHCHKLTWLCCRNQAKHDEIFGLVYQRALLHVKSIYADMFTMLAKEGFAMATELDHPRIIFVFSVKHASRVELRFNTVKYKFRWYVAQDITILRGAPLIVRSDAKYTAVEFGNYDTADEVKEVLISQPVARMAVYHAAVAMEAWLDEHHHTANQDVNGLAALAEQLSLAIAALQ
jgi:hypothetical protein